METTNAKQIGLMDKAQMEVEKLNDRLLGALKQVTTKTQEVLDKGRELPNMTKEFVENGVKKAKPVVEQMTNTRAKKVGLLAAGLLVTGGITALLLRRK